MSKDDGLAPSAQMLILFLYICRQAFKETRIQMIDDIVESFPTFHSIF
jgi:hypothetical protein